MSSEDLSKDINALDAKIVDLLAARFKAVAATGAESETRQYPLQSAGHDNEVIESIRALAQEKGLDANGMENIYRQILSISKNLHNLEVAFPGEDGSHGQEVAFKLFGRSIKTRQCDTIDEVFDLVQHGSPAYGIVPAENSQDGSIGQSYDLLLESDVKVCGETQTRTSYCLIGNKAAGLNSIKKIYAHPQALAQCQAFLRHLGGELIPTYNTINVVKMIKEKKLADSAVVAGEGIAFTYDMKVLAREIEDNPRNFTRYFILGKQDSPPTGKDKTSIVILLKHKPGTLCEVVSEFAKRGINLTKIESRPTRKTPWEYHFYLDFEGHREDKEIAATLVELEKSCLFLKVLGSYPRTKTQ